ncbi:MAG: AAA family ATPase, partial [Anaerolineales bacterium]|nr:AAA family ATPase [Anaerolineales bacterium]
MNTPKALSTALLCNRCDETQFSFANTAELKSTDEIIGQPRAVEAIRFGIGIQHEGFNLFALGPNGVGKHTVVTQFLEQKANSEATPDDWCYVNNFEQPHKPVPLRLPTGLGSQLRDDMNRFLEDLLTVIPAALNSEEYNAQKKTIIKELRTRETEAVKQIEEEAKAKSISVINTPSGIAFAPLRDGEVMSPEAF